MEKAKRFTIRRVLLAAVLLVIFSFIATVLFNISQFYKTLNAFSGAVSRGNQLAARDYLQNLQYFYELNKTLKPLWLDGIANKYLFKDVQYRQSAYDYLTGNHEKVIKELQDYDDYWARYIRSNSRWRIAQGIFEQSLKMDAKTKQEMQEQAKEMAVSTKDDYEQAIKKWETPIPWLPAPWNYDITIDPSAMNRALVPKSIKIKVVLGEGGKKGNNPGDRNGNAPGRGTLDLDKKGGDKPSPSPNLGVRREG